VVDTANALLTAHALQALQLELKGLQQSLLQMAHAHAATPVLGRSLLQPAQITSFGLKCAQSAAALGRSCAQLNQHATQALCVQLGGAVGNSATFGSDALRVEHALARRLGLKACGHSWHTQRDAWMRLGMEVAVCGGSLAKLAKDWALHAQYEVGELCEAPRGITSSAMPHKRNPVHCLQALAQTKAVPQLAATLLACMDQAHERALGEWQAEVVHWAQLWTHVHAAAAALAAAAQGMQVHAPRMQAHIDSLQGVVFSEQLTQVILPLLGKPDAQATVALCAHQALQQGQSLPVLLVAYLKEQGHAVSEALHAQLHAAADAQVAAQASAMRCHELLAQMASVRQPAPLTGVLA
jgi:3-carboxy-cis,cis-muconate cycloisomerase